MTVPIMPDGHGASADAPWPSRPDERAFRRDIVGAVFLHGFVRHRWRLLSITWPHAVLAVTAAPRSAAPSEYTFRFELTNYPQNAPTAQLWDPERDAPLSVDLWPGGRSRVPAVFRPDWKNGTCLYLPCDRISFSGHDVWRQQHPSLLWSPAGDITQYLRIIHELLTSADYTGVRG